MKERIEIYDTFVHLDKGYEKPNWLKYFYVSMLLNVVREKYNGDKACVRI